MNYKRSRPSNYASIVRKALNSFYKKQKSKTIAGAGKKKDESKRGESKGKKTDIVMAISTVVLTVGTLALFFEASRQTKEVKDEFKIANTPYLQLAKIIDSIHEGQSPMITYSIENLGKVPCKIMWVEFADSISNQTPVIGPFGLPTNTFASSPIQNRTPINRYSIESSPYIGLYTSGYILTNKAYSDLKSATAFHYFYGIAGYINQMSGEERIYEFRVQIFQSPYGSIQMLINDNNDIWDYEVKHRIMINE